MKLLIFGGTSEGRILAEALCRKEHDVTVSCATALGCEELGDIPCRKLCGRMDVEEIRQVASNFDMVIDATHPYAAIVTANIKEACGNEIPLRRIQRQSGEAEGVILVKSCSEAASFLENKEGNVLLTTGAKELSAFGNLNPERIFARILPMHEGLEVCERIHLPHKNIIAMQGPFSGKMNEALMEQFNIAWMVTKNSGRAGGFEEKIEAAKKENVSVVLVERPEDAGISMEELLDELDAQVDK